MEEKKDKLNIENENIENVNEVLNEVETVDAEANETEETQPAEAQEEATVNIELKEVLQWGFYILGVVFLIIGMRFYFNDLDYYSSPMNFNEERYVGGDAYNYIISAARSTAVMVKSLIWVVMGCTSLLFGRTFTKTKE